MTLAPASKAALASRAICSGVTGTWCCLGSVSTPFSAQVMTALSLMDQPSMLERVAERTLLFEHDLFGKPVSTFPDHALAIMRPALAGFLRPRAIVGANGAAAVDRQLARPGKDRPRLQAVKPSDRVAEMRGVGIADIRREMREVDVLAGEVE